MSRAQIARETALSKPTVSQALAGLLRAKLVREAGRSSGGKGPTAVLYELNPHAGWVVGIDVGRHWVRAAIADVTGEFVARRDERARVKSARTLITQIGAVAHGLAGDAGIRWKQVTFATVGSPGVLEADRGQVALAYALPGWGRQGLVEAVQQELGTKIAFENDVNLAALGEQWHGIGKGVENFAFLHLGTGVGMGLVLNGELYRGSGGAAGEVGYLPLAGTDLRDPSSRRRGPLDAAGSAAGVVATARRLGMTPPLTAKKVFTEARKGDAKAKRVVRTEAARIALAIAATIEQLRKRAVMARYDDDDRTHESDDTDADDYPRRSPDYPPARRDLLMQRRLRAARGEEAEPEVYEDDYAPPPRYARARSNYPPAYSSGNGCASAVLYLVLGGVAIVLLVLMFGRQLVSSFVPNVPQQVRQLVATPTTTCV